MSVRKLGHDCKEACRLRRSRPSIEVVNVDLLFKFTFSTTPPGPLGGVGALVKEFSSSTPAPKVAPGIITRQQLMFVGPKKVEVIQGGDWRLIQVAYIYIYIYIYI